MLNKAKHFFSQAYKFIKKYKYILAIIFIVLTIILFNVISSVSRVGFNMNVVNDQNKPEDSYYLKLLKLPKKSELIYSKITNELTSNLKGLGTKENPYLIEKPNDLLYINDLLKQRFYVKKGDKNTNSCSRPTLNYEQTFTSSKEKDGYLVEYVIKLSNSSNNDIKRLNLNISNKSKHQLSSLTINDIESSFSSNDELISINSSTTIQKNSSIEIKLSYISSTPENDLKIESYTGYDENSLDYYGEQDCSYEYFDTTNMYFKFTNNLDFDNKNITGIGYSYNPFKGIIDGNYKTITNLNLTDEENDENSTGLFRYIENATIKSINISTSTLNIKKSTTATSGILIGSSTKSSKIYNIGVLSGDVLIDTTFDTSSYIGGIVGYIADQTIVANSFNYANITSNIKNNNNLTVGGLVGYRTGINTKLDDENPKVYLLAMYGKLNIESSSSYQYVYNGNIFASTESPTYCYYLWDGATIDTSKKTANTYAILKSYDDLIADGFKAHLNNYRYMVSYYVGESTYPRENEESGYKDIAYWYTKNNESLYPILKERESNNSNYNLNDITLSSKKDSIKVNLVDKTNNNLTKTYYIKITDKDELTNDFTNHKIKLPFNSKTSKFKYAGTGKNGNYTMTLTGWRLTSVVTNGKKITSSIDGSKINYNYVLREGEDGASKDINTIYSEGGFYLVPDGVTEITLEAYYGYTIYAKDAEYDKVYNLNYSENDSTIFGLTNSSDSFDGLTEKTAVSTLEAAYSKIRNINYSNRQTMYDAVIMLCGNLHYNPRSTVTNGSDVTTSDWAYTQTDVPVTIMSMDKDGDLEPDYALYTRNVHDENIPTLRLNFINFLGIPQVGTINAKLNALTLMSNTSFEVTETSKTDRIDLRHYQANYIKLNSGYYNVYNLWNAESTSLNKKYLYFGGYAQAIYFNSGVESRALPQSSNNDVPTFVISGGRIDTLSSTYFNAVIGVSNKVYFFVDGGYINKFYTTYNASIAKSVEVVIKNSYINTYYAGGHTESSTVSGGVTTNIESSKLDSFYGGPEYGSIKKGSTIKINNTEINNFYGSGYGGTQTTEINLVYQDAGSTLCSSDRYYYNIASSCTLINSTNMSDSNKSYCFGRMNKSYGLETKFYATTYSKAGCASKAFAVYYSSLSAANVDNVTIDISSSIINNDFYGGGNKGIVDKNVVVNMENTTIKGNLYGGGRSNEQENLEVYEDTTGYSAPQFISYNVDTEAIYPKKYTYTWSGDKTKFKNNSYVNKEEKLIYSENDGKLGNVNGNIYLNIKNSTINDSLYGGGNLSEVIGNIYINLSGKNTISNYVYGGGKESSVTGNIDLRINNQKLNEVYGGGNKGNVIGKSTITLTNSSNVKNVYGGGRESSVDTTEIYLTSVTSSSVYGGSNTLGTVKQSNVYAGTLNPECPQTKPEEEETPPDESDYLPDLDTCKNRDFFYSYNYNNGYFNFSITNNLDKDIVSWEAKITFENAIASTNNWSGHKNSWSGNEILTITHEGQWYGPSTTTLSKNSTTTLFENNYPISLSSGSNIIVKSVVITGYDSSGNAYTNETCHDETPPTPEKPGGDIQEEIKVNVENIYGGNNIGGLCENTNVVIEDATINNVFGGGNLVNTNETNVTINEKGIINKDVYGGGNEAKVNEFTNVLIKSATINGSAYAGGNGESATVIKNTSITVTGNTTISGSVFGGGNKAETGTLDSNSSVANVLITGGTIKNNVYGGANTSRIFGNTIVNIGASKECITSDIFIGGTVFGGGEANASGSENYDYSYISVTKGIDITLDEENTSITINGSVFGSGNASSTSGYSNISIKNFGTGIKPKKLISIQRCSDLLLNNSNIVISGTTDRTNEYNSIIYSLSRIDELELANNSTIYLQNGTNVLKKVSSYYIDENGKKEKSSVKNITKTPTTNANNRIYMSINKALNIINSENLATGTFGEVNGMIFFGLFELDRDNLPSTGIYNPKYTNGSKVSQNELYQFISGSYVMAQHKQNHNYEVDGFYTNYATESGEVSTKYIEPTPEDAKYYQWIVGESATTFEIGLTASKFATMGTTSLPLVGFEKENTYFEFVSYNDNNLKNGVSLINPEEVPRVGKTDEDALSTFGLKMNNSNSNWLTDGNTYFLSTKEASKIMGTSKYVTNNTNEIPVLDFIFVHSKNITEDKKLGSVTAGLLAYIPIDEVTYKIERIYININLDTRYYETDNYESSMTPGKEYELFVNSKTNITSKSSLSAYFSLFVRKDESIYKDAYHRVLISNYKLPVNTRITLVDRTVSSAPEYYYYDVPDEEVSTEIVPNALGIDTKFYIYPLSNFIRVGSTSENNNYNDTEANKKYFNKELGVNEEEFIFIVDYSEAKITSSMEDAELLLELKDEDEYTHYDSLGVSHSNMVYNIYSESDADIIVNLETDKQTAYHGYDFNIKANLIYNEKTINNAPIRDTNYIQDKMGLKITMYNSQKERVNGATLIGTIFNINGTNYYADIDGSVRANISDYVSDVLASININLEKSILPTDNYEIVVESFGSPDGLYYGLASIGESSVKVNIINENYGLISTTDDESIIVDSKTGTTSKETNQISYNIKYTSQFSNPKIYVSLYRRKYDEIYSQEYELVDLQEYVYDTLTKMETSKYLVTDNPDEFNSFIINLKNNLPTGTYKVSFELHDDKEYIDSISTYLIIK